MGAWGVLAFDNDTANDWVFDLDEATDLSLVDSAIVQFEAASSGYLDADIASNALAACEVVARLQGRPGYTNAYTDTVDRWVAAHLIQPSAQLVERCLAAIDRILGENSELAELWVESEGKKWRAAMIDLRVRVCP